MANHFLHLSTICGCLFFATCCEAINQQASSTAPITSNLSQGELDAALLNASRENDYEAAKAALDAGASPDASFGPNHPNTLDYAAYHLDNKILKLLIERGATQFDRRWTGGIGKQCPLKQAVLRENFEAADILRSHGATTKRLDLLCELAAIGSVKGIQYLLAIGEDINEGQYYRRPLDRIWEIDSEDLCLETLQVMLDNGLDISQAIYRERNMPLSKAARLNYLKVAKLLLERGADPTWKNIGGKDAFQFATTPEMKALLELYRPEANNK